MLTLRKKPWSKLSGEHGRWDGQTDTGGNHSSDLLRYVSPSGLIVSVSKHVSFSTGTKSWYLRAMLKPA